MFVYISLAHIYFIGTVVSLLYSLEHRRIYSKNVIISRAPNSEDAYRTEELVTLPEEDLINVNLNIEVSPMRDSSTSDVRDDCSWCVPYFYKTIPNVLIYPTVFISSNTYISKV